MRSQALLTRIMLCCAGQLILQSGHPVTAQVEVFSDPWQVTYVTPADSGGGPPVITIGTPAPGFSEPEVVIPASNGTTFDVGSGGPTVASIPGGTRTVWTIPANWIARIMVNGKPIQSAEHASMEPLPVYQEPIPEFNKAKAPARAAGAAPARVAITFREPGKIEFPRLERSKRAEVVIAITGSSVSVEPQQGPQIPRVPGGPLPQKTAAPTKK